MATDARESGRRSCARSTRNGTESARNGSLPRRNEGRLRHRKPTAAKAKPQSLKTSAAGVAARGKQWQINHCRICHALICLMWRANHGQYKQFHNQKRSEEIGRAGSRFIIFYLCPKAVFCAETWPKRWQTPSSAKCSLVAAQMAAQDQLPKPCQG